MTPKIILDWLSIKMSEEIRWCSVGDTISTTKRMSTGTYAGDFMHVVICNSESCAEANNLIAAGRWEVSACGRCNMRIMDCCCKLIEKPINVVFSVETDIVD